MRRPSSVASLLASSLLVVACGGGSSSAPSGVPPVPPATSPSTSASNPSAAPTAAAPTTSATPSAAASATPIASGADFVVGGDRPLTVQLPDGYDPLVSAPLLLSLHGYGSSAAENEAYLRVGAEASSRGLLFAAPEGTMDGRRRFWNATDACCDFAQIGTDDSAWLAEVIVEAEAVANVDPKRIYVIGHSNGGFMSYRMACDHADLVAAIVSLAGATFADPDDCRPSEPVAVLQIHGTADPTIRYEGGTIDLPSTLGAQPGPYPGARETAELWAGYDGCSTTPGLRPDMLDLDAGLVGPVGAAETTVEVYPTTCRPGGHVELWTIQDGGHVPSLTGDFAPSVVDFLLAHPKP